MGALCTETNGLITRGIDKRAIRNTDVAQPKICLHTTGRLQNPGSVTWMFSNPRKPPAVSIAELLQARLAESSRDLYLGVEITEVA
jgi:hypothetical protein